jgi:hypothetical protein
VNTAQMTGSIWVKTNDGTTKSIVFRLNASGESTTAVSVNGTWQRITVTGSSSSVLEISLRGDWTGASASADLLVWHPQNELGASATDYQKAVSAHEVTEATVHSVDHFLLDGSDDFFSHQFPGAAGPTDWNVSTAMDCKDALRFVLGSNYNNAADFMCLGWDGFTGGDSHGIGDVWIDGTQYVTGVATRNDLYDAIVNQGWVLIELRNINVSGWTGVHWGTLGVFTGFEYDGKLANIYTFRNGANAAQKRSDAKDALNIQLGGVLP